MTGRKPGLIAIIWNKRKKINIQQEQNEEIRIQKGEETLTNLWDNLKCSNTQIIGVPEEKNNSKKLKTYSNK